MCGVLLMYVFNHYYK